MVVSIWLLKHARGNQFNADILFYMMIKCSAVIFLKNLFFVKPGTGGNFVRVSHFQEAQVKNPGSQSTNYGLKFFKFKIFFII